MRKILLTIIATFLTVATVKAQIYHEECKEDLREFMRQGTNQKLVPTVADTLSWYENEDWVSKVWGLSWTETDETLLRIDSVNWSSAQLEGKLKLSSPVMRMLICEWNNLTELDVSNNTLLEELYCNNSNLSELDVSNNTLLKRLNCANNNLSELDISNNTLLKRFQCSNNNLTELDVSENTELETLAIWENNLTELDISKNLELIFLNCANNNLSELDLSKNTKLNHLDLRNNKFKFSTLPLPVNYYYYSPQDTIDGGEKGFLDTVDLSDEYLIGEHITNYNWFDITNGIEQTVEQPTNENGVFTFIPYHAEKRLRCKMTNAQFPALTLVYEVEIKTVNINETPEITFTVSPNPANDKLTIHHSEEIENIGLYDLSGRLLRTYSGAGTITVIDISDLDSGVYFLTVAGKSVKFVKE